MSEHERKVSVSIKIQFALSDLGTIPKYIGYDKEQEKCSYISDGIWNSNWHRSFSFIPSFS